MIMLLNSLPLLAFLASYSLGLATPISYDRPINLYAPGDLTTPEGFDTFHPAGEHAHVIRAKKKPKPAEPKPPAYGEFQEKGQALFEGLNNPCVDTVDTTYEDLANDGWEFDETKGKVAHELLGMARNLGLPDSKGYTQVDARKEFIADGILFPSSFENTVGNGAIFALENSRHGGPAWSTVASATFRKFDGGDLKYIFRTNVANDETKPLVEQIYRKNNLNWPSEDFREWLPDSDEYMAILGSPNGKGVAWLLMQGREHFGHKKIAKITTWAEGQDLKTLILFTLED